MQSHLISVMTSKVGV